MYASSFPIALALILGVIALAVLWLFWYDAPADSKLRQRRFFLWMHVWIVVAAAVVCGVTWFTSVSFEVPSGDSDTTSNNVFSDFVSED